MYKRVRKKKRKNLPVCRKDWDSHVAELRAGEFQRRYRMSIEKFNFLLTQCAAESSFFRELDAKKSMLARNAYGRDPIDPRHKLAAAIRFWCGGSYLDIRLVHGMCVETLYVCVWTAVDAINSSRKLQMYFPWDDEEGLQELEQGFSKISGGKVRGCVFSVDGFCVRIICPIGVINPRDFWHRKGFYAYVVQAVVNATGKFTAASIKAIGSTHDALAFRMSSFYAKLEAGMLSRSTGLTGVTSFFGMGDDAYGNKEYCLTPYPGRDLPEHKDSFNYYQSLLRASTVECAFGRLTQRWGCLWKPLRVAHQRVPPLLFALMKLHNLCDTNSPVIIHDDDVHHLRNQKLAPQVFTNELGALTGSELHQLRNMQRLSRSERDGLTRRVVTDHLQNIGATRPPHSRYRSRTQQTARTNTRKRAPKRSAPMTETTASAPTTTATITNTVEPTSPPKCRLRRAVEEAAVAEHDEAVAVEFTNHITAQTPSAVESDDLYVGVIKEVKDPLLIEKYLRMGCRLAKNVSLPDIIHTYSGSLVFGRQHRAYFKKTFNMLDPFLIYPPTPLTDEGGLTPVRYVTMIDTRTNMSIGETLRMMKVYLRSVVNETTRL